LTHLADSVQFKLDNLGTPATYEPHLLHQFDGEVQVRQLGDNVEVGMCVLVVAAELEAVGTMVTSKAVAELEVVGMMMASTAVAALEVGGTPMVADISPTEVDAEGIVAVGSAVDELEARIVDVSLAEVEAVVIAVAWMVVSELNAEGVGLALVEISELGARLACISATEVDADMNIGGIGVNLVEIPGVSVSWSFVELEARGVAFANSAEISEVRIPGTAATELGGRDMMLAGVVVVAVDEETYIAVAGAVTEHLVQNAVDLVF